MPSNAKKTRDSVKLAIIAGVALATLLLATPTPIPTTPTQHHVALRVTPTLTPTLTPTSVPTPAPAPALPGVRRTSVLTDADGRAVIWTGAVSYSVVSSGPEHSETCSCLRGDITLLAKATHRSDPWCGWSMSGGGKLKDGDNRSSLSRHHRRRRPLAIQTKTWRSCGACLTMCRADRSRPPGDGGAHLLGSGGGAAPVAQAASSSSSSPPLASPSPLLPLRTPPRPRPLRATPDTAESDAVLEQRRLAPPGFAAVCVQKPPEAFTDRRVIAYFVRYYLARGFGEVTLYTWDHALAFDIPGAHWIVVPFVKKTEPVMNRHQQIWVQWHCLHLHKQAGTQWVLSLDLDEFVACVGALA